MNIEETTPRFEFDDLSFSGIVNIIDTDEKIGKEFIIEVYNEIHKTPKAATEYYLWWAKIAHDIEEECYNDCFKGVRVSFPIF